MQGSLVARKVSVRLSVSLSVKRVDCDKTEELKCCPDFLYRAKHHFAYSFLRKECMGWPLLSEILDQRAPVRAKSPILNRYSLVAPQP